MSMVINHKWPACECGHAYWDHHEDLVCAMAFLDACYGYWPTGFQVSRGEMWTRHGGA